VARFGRDGRSPATEVVGRRRSFSEMNPTTQENTHMFVAYDVALDLIRALRPVVTQLRTYSPDAADQIERAGSSIVLNLAEGARRHGRDPRRFFAMAHGSAGEIRGALDLADAWGWQVESAQARLLLDRELGLLWGLTRRGRSKDAPTLPPSATRAR
jgi:four helix bundle protein